MGSARGAVTVEVAGEIRKLRLSLAAADEIETKLGPQHGGGLMAVLGSLAGGMEKARFGTILVLFEELCRAGGTPLSDEDRDALMPSDLPAIAEAIIGAATASGAINRTEPQDGADPEKKKPPTSEATAPSPGAGGNSSHSDT